MTGWSRRAEIEELTRQARRERLAKGVAAQTTQAQAESAGTIGKLYPSMSAGLVRAFAGMGVSPTADWLLDMAREEAYAGSEAGTDALFRIVDARVLRERRRRNRELDAQFQAGEIDGMGLLEESQRLASPGAYRELGEAAGVGFEARMLGGRMVSQVESRGKALPDSGGDGGLLDDIGDVARGTVRNVVGFLDLPKQYTQQTWQNIVQGARDGGVWGAATAPMANAMGGMSPVGFAAGAVDAFLDGGVEGLQQQALREGMAGYNRMTQNNFGAGMVTGFDQGDGWFLGGEQEAFRQAQEQRYAPKINGRVVTLGRSAADAVGFQPDSRPYGLLSGLVDGFVAVAGPGEILLDDYFRAVRAGRNLQVMSGAAPREGAGLLNDARGVLDQLGALRTHRVVVSPERVRAFLDSSAGGALVRRIAEADDAFDLYRLFGRRIDGDLVAQLRNAPDEGVIRSVLNAHLGVDLAKPGRFTAGRIDAAMALQSMNRTAGRLFARMPTGVVDLEDSAEAARQMENLVRNARGSGDDVRYWVNRILGEGMPRGDEALARITADQAQLRTVVDDLERRIIDATSQAEVDELTSRWQEASRMLEAPGTVTNRLDRNAVINEFMGEQAERLAGRVGRDVTRRFAEEWEESRAYWVRVIADGDGAVVNVNPWVGGRAITAPGAPTPHLIAEHVGRYAPVGDVRAMRREFSTPLFRYLSGGEVTGGTAARLAKRGARAPITVPTSLLLHVQDKVWKPLRLLRLAWPVRVLSEEQVRIAAAGYDGVFNHPIRYIAAVLADDGYLANRIQNRAVGKALKEGDTAAAQALEEAFGIAASHSDEFRRAMFTSTASIGLDRTAARVRNQGYRIYAMNDPEYALGWQDELARAAASPEVQLYLKAIDDGQGMEGFVDALTRMTDYRRSLQRLHPDADLLSPEGIRAWADSVAERVRQITVDDPELIDVLRTRRIKGEFLWKEGSVELNPRATEAFRVKIDEVGDRRPGQVVGPNRQYVEDNRGMWNRGIDVMFAGLMTYPANAFSRSPLFVQAYTESLIRHARALDPDDAGLLVDDLVKLGARKSDIRQVRYLAGQAPPPWLGRTLDDGTVRPGMPISDLEQLARAEALEVVKKTLFDVSERGQFFDVFRLIFPFGEAWKEVVTRWAGLVADNPQVLRRGSQVISQARNPEVAETLGLPAPEGQGFFYENSFGEEVFTFPFSAGLNETMTGVPIPLTGRVQGLSIMTEVMPGVGPAMQVPIAVVFEDLLGDNPRWNWLRDILSPFGSAKGPDGKWTIEDGVAEFIPPWAQRVLAAEQLSEDPRTVEAYADSLDYSVNYLASTGNYDLFGPDAQAETARMLEDARDAAGKLLWIRSVATFIGPTSPMAEPVVEDESGAMTLTRVLAQAYYDMQAEDYTTATERFVEQYGEFAFLATVGQTRSVAVGGALPPYAEAWDWLRERQGLDRDFGNVFGFFAPQTGSFDATLLEQSVRNGDRVRLSAEQRVAVANHALGSMLYWNAREQLPEQMSQEQRVWLKDYEEQLKDELPGFNALEAAGIIPRVPQDQIVDELEAAVNDPRLADNEVAEATRLYMEARRQAIDAAVESGLSPLGDRPAFSSANRAEPLRLWLFNYGTQLAAEVPGFDRVFQSVFLTELPIEDPEQEG